MSIRFQLERPLVQYKAERKLLKVWLGGVMAKAQIMTDALPAGVKRAVLIPLLILQWRNSGLFTAHDSQIQMLFF